MKNKAVVPLAIAVICGLAASFMITKYGFGKEEETIPVLRAKKNLEANDQLLKPDDLFEIAQVRKKDHENALKEDKFPTEIAKLKNRYLKNSVRKHEIIRESDLWKEGESPIQARLKEGEMAFSLKTRLDTAAGGFIRPGDEVNVSVSERTRSDDRYAPRVILHRLEILAVNDQVQTREGTQHVQADYVTLKVVGWQSLVLTKYKEMGSPLQLVLRKKGDNTDDEVIKKEKDHWIKELKLNPSEWEEVNEKLRALGDEKEKLESELSNHLQKLREFDQLALEKENLLKEKDLLAKDKDKLVLEKETLAKEKNDLLEARVKLVEQIDLLTKEISSLKNPKLVVAPVAGIKIPERWPFVDSVRWVYEPGKEPEKVVIPANPELARRELDLLREKLKAEESKAPEAPEKH
jgi:Flp pilus assembly protein CpaB